jgi:hypothetical protein
MPKLIDNHRSHEAIGNDGLLRFIDEINVIRARSHNRRRFRPQQRVDGVVWMQEYDEVQRPRRADTLSPRYGR